MAYDEVLASRIGEMLADDPDHAPDITEKKMFGGLAFLVRDHMVVAASREGGLLVRCDKADIDDHLANGAERMVMGGREMSGWLFIDAAAVAEDGDLARWIEVGLTRVASLPPK